MPRLSCLLVALLGLSWWGVSAAAVAAVPVQLTEAVTLLRGRFVAGSQPDGNSVLLRGPDSVIVFDAGRHPEHADALLDSLKGAAAASVVLVNSHWHLDHSGGLIRLRAAYPDAPLYASPAIDAARRGFLAHYRAQLQSFAERPVPGAPNAEVIRSETALIDGSDSMQPTHPVTDTGTLELAGRTVVLGLGSGVSGGDVWLFDPATRVLLAGDLVTQPAPLFDTACARRWLSDLDALAAQPFDMLVPGHGAPMRRAAFDAWRHDLAELVNCAAQGREVATCRDGWLGGQASALAEVDHALAYELLGYYLSGPLTAAGQAERCATDTPTP